MKTCPQCGVRYTLEDVFCAVDGAPLVVSNDPFLGQTVGSYRVVRLLGEGGMGRVYLGLHPRIGSRVAIKLLSPATSGNDSMVQRFFAEAQLVNKVRHEGIVNVLDLDHLEDGRPYIIMEYLDGEPLSSAIARGPMALGTAATIGIEILEALQAAHDCGVVHRDLKPDNIFLSPKGRVKLLDFGIAKLMPEFETKAIGPSTRTGALLGTPGYMAPEQVVGAKVSGATDLYAVGAVLYEALTGTMAFSGATLFELLRRIVNDTPPPPVQRRPEMAGPYEALILRALSKKPEERHGSANAMALELEAISKGLGPEQWRPLHAVASRPNVMGMDDTMLPAADTPLALGSEATMLADEMRPVALGSEATMLAGEVRPVALGSEATMLAPGSQASGPAFHQPPTPEQRISYSLPTQVSPPKTPWLLGIAVVALAGVATFAVLAGQESTNGEDSESRVASATRDAGAAPAPTATVMGKPPASGPTASGPTASGPTASGPATSVDAGAVPTPSNTGKERATSPSSERPSRRSAKPSQSTEPPAPTPSPTNVLAGEGTTTAPPAPPSRSGVTMIETGERHAKSQVHKAPDFNVRGFDAVAYLPKARKLAKQIYSDAVLVEFDAEGVAANGLVNLGHPNSEVTYNFLSRSHTKRKLPIGSGEDIPCWVYVEVDRKGVTARIVEQEECKGRGYSNPKCSMRQVWGLSDELGNPPNKMRAVSHITYMEGEWFFDIDPLNVTGTLPDKC